MKNILHNFILPITFGLLLTFFIFGLNKGSGVYDDYAWMIGVLVAIAGIYLSFRISASKK